MMPILHSPGLMMPGQLGPISRVFESFKIRFTLTCTTPTLVKVGTAHGKTLNRDTQCTCQVPMTAHHAATSISADPQPNEDPVAACSKCIKLVMA